MTAVAWVGIGLWGVGGFFVGLAWALADKRHLHPVGEDTSAGFQLLAGWLFAPVFAAVMVLAGIIGLFDRIVDAADARVPLTRSQMHHRIAQLEDELALDR